MLLSQKYSNDILSNYYVNKAGELKINRVKVNPYSWKEVDSDKRSSRTYTSWNGKKIIKSSAKTLGKYEKMEVLWRLPKEKQEDIFSVTIPSEAFIDIEVDFSNEFPKPEEAKFGISTISTVWLDKDKNTIKVILQTLKELTPAEKSYVTKSIKSHFKDFEYDFNVKYLYHSSEEDLLYTFFSKICRKFIILTGWYFVDFDWHYLWNRAKNIGLNPEEFFDYHVNISREKKTFEVGFPCTKGVIDLMEIFKKFNRSIDVTESNTLDFISGEILGIDKVDLPDSLDVIYENNFKEYCFYNIVDSILCLLIEEKTQVLKLFYTLSCISLCQLPLTLKATRSIETVLSKEFFEENKVLPNKGWDDESAPKKTKYAGAFVMEPIPGLYSSVLSRDFASLYPTSARMAYISPESYKGNYYKEYLDGNPNLFKKENEKYLQYIKEKSYVSNKDNIKIDDYGNVYTIMKMGVNKGKSKYKGNWFAEFKDSKEFREDYKNYLIENNYINPLGSYYIDPKGSIFSKESIPIFKKILDRFNENRQSHKRKMKSYIKERNLLLEKLNIKNYE